MAELKRINAGSIKIALDKADHYRLLNEPEHAESICLDVLEVDSSNQRAHVTLVLALTDQFPTRLHDAYKHAESLIEHLTSDYDRRYFQGIIYERWASTQIARGTGSRGVPEWIKKAMACYESAEKLAKDDNPDPLLRWNTCVRIKDRFQLNQPAPASLTRDIHSEFGDDVPPK